MVRLRSATPAPAAVDVPLLVLCTAVVLSLVRATDQPSLDVSVGGTEVAVVPADAVVALLGVLVVARLLGSGSLPRPARAITLAAGAFAAWLLASSAVNGAEAVVGAGKLLETGVLALGTVVFVQRRPHLRLLAGVVVAFTVAAVGWGLVEFARDPGERQGSFLGEHDLAALSTMSLTLALATLFVPGARRGPLTVAAGAAGALGVVLGAALASLLGLYLACAALLALAAARGALTRRNAAIVVLVAAGVTAAALPLRSGDLGFLQEWFGDETEETRPGRYSASWSQRLIYAYVGGRIFLDNPVFGTGWYGELPPEEWARYLPDARRRFSDEPARYFPRPERDFTPQQTYDQVLYELGLVGAALFLLLGAIAVRTAFRAGRAWPRGAPDEDLAYVPAAWIVSLAGALAGAALFGGIPLLGIFWLTLGVVALAPSLVPPRAAVGA
jgi:O-Antigen ligase